MKRKRRAIQPSRQPEGEDGGNIQIRDISGGKGFAIGSGARSIFIEIRSLVDLSMLLPLVQRHWRFLMVSIVLQMIAVMLWQRYADRFLISVWVLVAGMSFLEASLLGGYGLKKRSQQRLPCGIVMGVSLLALTGLTGFEYRRAVYPVPFETQAFGVAVAQFGEGPEFFNTSQAREVSRLVLQRLKQQAEENPDLRFVQFRPIGLVRTEAEAFEDGQRVGSDLVIWGQLQVSGVGTTLNFAILETPDKVGNPTFPRVLPLVETSAKGLLEIPTRKSEDIATSTTTIAAFTFGLAHYFQWDFAASARAFQEALQTAPQESETYLYLLHFYYGLSLQWPGQLETASEQFKLASALRPDDPAALLALAFGYRSLGRMEDASAAAHHAFELCTQRIQLGTDQAEVFFDRAVASEILQDWSAALNDYDAAVQKAPDLFLARIGVMRMHLVLNQIQDAIQFARETISLTEDSGGNPAWAYLYLALSHERNHDPTQARLAYEKATTLAPQVDWIHFQAGHFYAEIGDSAAAEREYKSLVEVSSNKPWAHSTLADFYAKNKRLAEAIAEYRAALQIDPGSSGTWDSLAAIYIRLAQIDEARTAFARAVAEQPSNFYARFVYGNFLYAQGELEAAITQWETAHQIDPRNCDLLLNLGWAYKTLGNGEQARNLYMQVLKLGGSADSDCLVEARKRLDELTP